MTKVLWITMIVVTGCLSGFVTMQVMVYSGSCFSLLASLLLIQAVHSYILLTANIEDVQNVAKRLVQLPISGQVSNIVRRAYDVFDEAYNRLSRSKGSGKYHMRTGERDDRDDSESNNAPDYADNTDFRRTSGVGEKAGVKKNQPKKGRVGSEPNERLDKSEEERDEQNKVIGEQHETTVGPSENRDQNEQNEGRAESEKSLSEPSEVKSESEKGQDDSTTKRADAEEFSTLGKSASVYLNKIKKIFENA